jgi:hypothetical protein
MKNAWIIGCLFLLLASGAYSSTFNAATCSQPDVLAAVNQAQNGDTVNVPAGSCPWSAGLTIGKGIKIIGAGGGGFVGHSTTSNSISTGSKTFITQSGLNIQAGETITVMFLANGASQMTGTVSSYSVNQLVLNINSLSGSGTYANWIFARPAKTTIINDFSNNWNVGLISLTESTATSIEVSGIRFVSGTAGNGGVHIEIGQSTNGKPVLIHDNWFTGTGTFGRSIETMTNRGVVYKNSFDNGLCSSAALGCSVTVTQAIGLPAHSLTTSWTTPSTMGMNDVGGVNNFYIEDNYFAGFWQSSMDCDDNSRSVIRHNVFDNTALGSHGADTSTFGVRHYEIYDNTFYFDDMGDNTYNLNWWFFDRGGTGVIADNSMPNIRSQAYGDKSEIVLTVMNLQRNAGPNPCWGANIAGLQYPAPRQIGMGYVTGTGGSDSVTYRGDSEPLYIWNNVGTSAIGLNDYGGTECTNTDSTSSYLIAGRDYILSAKTGYAKYTYPHPLRQSTTASSCEATGGHKCWYVDSSVASSGNGQSWATAWKSFSSIQWSGINPGDTLYISGGPSGNTKTYTESWSVQKGGTAGQPITIGVDAADPNHNGIAVFDYDAKGDSAAVNGITVSRDYITVDGNVAGENHIQIKNLRNIYDRNAAYALYADSVEGTVVDHVTFINNNGPVRLQYSTKATISNCDMLQVRGDAAVFLGGSAQPQEWDINRIFNNYIEILYNDAAPSSGPYGGPDGIQADSATSIFNNIFKVIPTTVYTSNQHPDGIQFANAHHLLVYNNEFINVGDSNIDIGAWSFDGSPINIHDIQIYNNIFRIEEDIDIYPDFIRLYANPGNIASINNLKIMNNLFIDNNDWTPIKFYDYGGNPSGSGNEIKNNIFYNLGRGDQWYAAWSIEDSSGFSSGSWTFDGNIYYNPSNTPHVVFRGTDYAAGAWVSAKEPHGKTHSPSFIRYAPFAKNNDFHLAGSDSVAKDSGMTLAYFSADKEGIARPQGSAWDIGPHEQAYGQACAQAADTDCNSCIDLPELNTYVNTWFSGSVQIKEMMDAIRIWKAGCPQ